MIDFSPDPQTRLIVVALVVSGRPASSAALRAGAWPTPACSTWPIRTSSTVASGGSPRSTAAAIATPPSSTAGVFDSAPPNLPIGVRAALTMNTAPFGPVEPGRITRPNLHPEPRQPDLHGAALGLSLGAGSSVGVGCGASVTTSVGAGVAGVAESGATLDGTAAAVTSGPGMSVAGVSD